MHAQRCWHIALVWPAACSLYVFMLFAWQKTHSVCLADALVGALVMACAAVVMALVKQTPRARQHIAAALSGW